MELTKTPEGTVTRLALARAIREIPYNKLATQVQVGATDVFSWERGQVTPRASDVKRLGLALRWPWQEFLMDPLPYEEAWERFLGARKAIKIPKPRDAVDHG